MYIFVLKKNVLLACQIWEKCYNFCYPNRVKVQDTY